MDFEIPRKNTIMYFISEILWTLSSRKRRGVSGVHMRGIFNTLDLKFSEDKLLQLINRCLKHMFELGMVKKTTPRKFLLKKEYRKFLNDKGVFDENPKIKRILGYHNL